MLIQITIYVYFYVKTWGNPHFDTPLWTDGLFIFVDYAY